MVFLVGAGTGDYRTITLRGLEALRSCDLVVYDRLVDPRLLGLARPGAETRYVGKAPGDHSATQEEISALLVEEGRSGKQVVRLKSGDPFVFGRGGEEAEALGRAGVPYEVVPGVTSAVAAPGAAGIPVTHRGVSSGFHVITGHGKNPLTTEGLSTLAGLEGTLLFLMSVSSMAEIAGGLILGGKSPDTPAAAVYQGLSPRQRVLRTTLGDLGRRLAEENFRSPAVIVVGDVAALDFRWRGEGGPLSGVKVGLTGTWSFLDRLGGLILPLGGTPLTLGWTETEAVTEGPEVEDMLRRLERYGWIAFASSAGVEAFFSLLAGKNVDLRRLGRTKFAAVGPGTGEALARHGFIPDYIPETYSGRDMGRGLAERAAPGETVLIPRGDRGSRRLPQALRSAGVPHREVTTYAVRARYGDPPDLAGARYVVFSSPLAVLPPGGEDRARVTVFCLGESTAEAAKAAGYEHVIQAEAATAESVVEALCEEVRRCSDLEG